jgi:phosphomannomutase
MISLKCFKAYDVRGKLGDELNEDVAYRIGRAFGEYLNAKTIVVGSDIRSSSDMLKYALIRGLTDNGTNVIDIGQTGTEEVYFASFYLDIDGGIEVTASHNPIDYNGMKFVGRGASPISQDNGLKQIKHLAEIQNYREISHKGEVHNLSILSSFVDHLLSYVNVSNLKPLKIVVNAGNGSAGHVIDEIELRFNSSNIPINFIKVHHEPDGTFPNGIPNPLLPENRVSTSDAIKLHNADIGIAWDGDFDRCFLFDEEGNFIEGYYIVGLLAKAFLKKHPGEKIIHDPRLIWNTVKIVKDGKGVPIQSKSGHAFIKERMRSENAIYGGEMSAHHYFRDFAYCDSGMIPWLLVIELLSIESKTLSQLVNKSIAEHPCSGEINYKVKDTQSSIDAIKSHYKSSELLKKIDETDGLSMEFPDWRFNLRASNTEPLLRLNVESRANDKIINNIVAEIEAVIKQIG